jgi:hypothetical protein
MPALVWRPGIKREGDCRLRHLAGVEDAFELRYGISRAAGWPDDAHCEFDPDYPKDVALSDSPDGAGVILASGRLKDALVAQGARNTELLPVTLINHKGRVAARDYHIVHPLEIVDCIDLAASAAEWNAIDDDVLTACAQLVLKPQAIPDDLLLFRPRFWPKLVLIRRRLADHLLGQGFTGLRFIEPADYTGLI